MAALRFQMPDFGVIWRELCRQSLHTFTGCSAFDNSPSELSVPGIVVLQSCWRRKMTPKCLGTCVIQPPGLSHHSCPIILLRSKGFEVPMIRGLLTPRGHLDRGSLCVELNQHSNNRLALMLSNAFMKPRASFLTSYETSGDELHQNEHVEPLCAFGLFVASLLVHLCVIVCMFVVGSDSVVVCLSVLSFPSAWRFIW